MKRQQAELALRSILPVQAYPFGREFAGSRDGLHCQVSASAVPFHTLGDPTIGAKLTGTFTLTYTGAHPPAITLYMLGGLPWPTLPTTRMLIAQQGTPMVQHSSHDSAGLFPATQVGPHKYLYWVVHWNHEQWPMTARQTRREIRTAVLELQLASGRTVNIALRPVIRQ